MRKLIDLETLTEALINGMPPAGQPTQTGQQPGAQQQQPKDSSWSKAGNDFDNFFTGISKFKQKYGGKIAVDVESEKPNGIS